MRFKRSSISLREIEDLYRSGFGSFDIAKLYGVSQGTIMNLFMDAGIQTRKRKDYFTKKADREFFKSIDREDKAYWLGFVIADGCVMDHSVTIGLAEKDREHVEKFKLALNSEHSVRTCKRDNGSDKVSISISSVDMVNDLRSLGVTRRKSLTVAPPKVDDELVRHMVRGIFDGDGCICISKIGQPKLSVIGSLATCEYISNWVMSISGYKTPMRKVGPVYVVFVCAKSPAKKVLSEMYQDCTVSLTRKYEKAMSYIGGCRA